MIGPKIYIYEEVSGIRQLVRLVVIIGGVSLAIIGGAIITGLEWITGKDFNV